MQDTWYLSWRVCRRLSDYSAFEAAHVSVKYYTFCLHLLKPREGNSLLCVSEDGKLLEKYHYHYYNFFPINCITSIVLLNMETLCCTHLSVTNIYEIIEYVWARVWFIHYCYPNSYGKLWGSNAFKFISMENKISGLISTCFVVTPYKQISSSVEIEQAYWTPLSFT